MLSKSLPKYNKKKNIKAKAFKGCKKLNTFGLTGLYADIKISKNAFQKDKKAIKVKTYNNNKYVKRFAKNISEKGKANKEAKIKDGVTVHINNGEKPTFKEKKSKKTKKSSKKK